MRQNLAASIAPWLLTASALLTISSGKPARAIPDHALTPEVQASIDARVSELEALLPNLLCRERITRTRFREGFERRQRDEFYDVMFVRDHDGPLGLRAVRFQPDDKRESSKAAPEEMPEPMLWWAILAEPRRRTLGFQVTRRSFDESVIEWQSAQSPLDLSRHDAWSGRVTWDMTHDFPSLITAEPNFQLRTIDARRMRRQTAFKINLFGWVISTAKRALVGRLTVIYDLQFEGQRLPRRAELTIRERVGATDDDENLRESTVVEYSECHRFATDTEQKYERPVDDAR
ncbi:MAG: hypothetical protein U0V87_13725 [Acidobacteriota bacterium]